MKHKTLAPPKIAPSAVTKLHDVDHRLRHLYNQQYYERKWSPDVEYERSFLKRRRDELLSAVVPS